MTNVKIKRQRWWTNGRLILASIINCLRRNALAGAARMPLANLHPAVADKVFCDYPAQL
jgi:hypothetical protein